MKQKKHTHLIETQASNTVQSKDINVWLVEDNQNFSNAIMCGFNAVCGIKCTRHFSNAEEAIKSLKTDSAPQVVLLDMQLPGMNGIEAIKLIKKIRPAIDVLMLTVYEDEIKIFGAIRAGASGYLLKTSSILEIKNSIEQVIAGGTPMTPKVARAVLKMFSGLPAMMHDYGLTDREQEILHLMAKGMIKKEIAETIHLSYHTVDSHIRAIYTKMHVHTSAGAVAKAFNMEPN